MRGNGYNEFDDTIKGRVRSPLRRPARDDREEFRRPHIVLQDHFLTVVDAGGENAFELTTDRGTLRFDKLKAYDIFLPGKVNLYDAKGNGVEIRMSQSSAYSQKMVMGSLAFRPHMTEFRHGHVNAAFLRASDLRVGDYLAISIPRSENRNFNFSSFLKHSYIRAVSPGGDPHSWLRDLSLADKGIKPLPAILRFPANTI